MRGRKFNGEKVRSIRRELDIAMVAHANRPEFINRICRQYHVLPPAVYAVIKYHTWNHPKYIPAAFCHECGRKVVANENGSIALCVHCGADYLGKLPVRP